MARKFSSVAGEMILQTGINATSGGITLDTISGLPTSFPFTLIIDLGSMSEEVVEATASGGGTSLLISRGVDGTSAAPHSAGSKVVHGPSARDFNEPLTHIDRIIGVHGVTSGLVGVTDTQTLDKKTFTSGSAITTALTVRATGGQSASLQKWTDSSGTALTTVEPTGRVVTPGVDGKDSVFTASGGSSTALTAKGSSTQTANVFSVRNGSNVEMLSVGATGTTTATKLASGDTTVTASGPTAVPVTVKADAAQTADLTQWTSSAGTELAAVTSAGRVSATGVDAGATVLTAASATDVPLTAKGASAQTANLVEVQKSDGTVVVKADEDGAVTAPSITATGAITGATGTFGNLPKKVVTGRGALSIPGNTVAYTGTINFGSTLTSPVVIVSTEDDQQVGAIVSVDSLTGTSFRLKVRNVTSNTVTGAAFCWIAIGS